MYTESLLNHEKKILTLAKRQVNLENTMLNELSEKEKTYCMISLTSDKEINELKRKNLLSIKSN